MKNILLIEDNKDMVNLVDEILGRSVHIDSGCFRSEIETYLTRFIYDLCIVDLNLPDSHGFEMIRLIRKFQQNKFLPIIVLTGDRTEASEINSYNIGVADYVTKPIKPGVFRARILNKINLLQSEPNVLQVGPIKIDFPNFTVSIINVEDSIVQTSQAERAIELTPIEFKTLVCLTKHNNCVVSRDLLSKEVWGSKINVGQRVIDQHVCSLRKKMSPYENLIHTIFGVGYKFTEGSGKHFF